MAPVTRSQKKKKDLETSVNQKQSDSSRCVKRSAEEEVKKKSEETNTENKSGIRQKNAEGENQQKKEEPEKELSESSHSETSFMDLPDDVHTNILPFLDLASQLKLRLNKRLDRLQISVKNEMKKIELHFGRTQSELTMGNLTPVQSSNFILWEEGLRRIAQNTFVKRILINTETEPNEQHCRVIEALFQFKAYSLNIHDTLFESMSLSRLTLSSFLTLAQNVRKVHTNLNVTSFSAHQLCIIRKTMVEGGCKMKSLNISIEPGMKKLFNEECFGVTIEYVTQPDLGKIYRSANDSLEMYVEICGIYSYLVHFEGNLKTTIGSTVILFEKVEVVEKPHDKYKLKLDHVYGHDDEEDEEADQ